LTSATCYRFSVNASNNAGLWTNVTSTNEVKVDTSAPSGGSISYLNDTQTSAATDITFSNGTDTESGINANTLQERTATYTTSCGAFGSWDITASNISSPYNRAGMIDNTCYQWRLNATNLAGLNATYTNVSTYIKVPPPPGQPEITSSAPTSPAYNVATDTRTFNVTVNQTVDVTWYINGSTLYTNNSVTNAYYNNSTPKKGTWNITAIASNANGTDQQTWTWIVNNSPPTQPSLDAITPTTAYKSSTLSTSASGSTDADSDSITYYYQWRDNDNTTVLQDWSTTNTFDCNANPSCTKGDTIYAWAKAVTSDANSTNATTSRAISNSVPTQPSLSAITPTTAYKSSTLSTSASGSTDADSDSITYYYQWRDTDNTTVLQNWSTTNTFDCNANSNCQAGDTIYAWGKAVTSDANSTNATTSRAISPDVPGIISWGNTKTNNASLTISINVFESVTFNATANQTGTMTWRKDGSVAQTNASASASSYATSWGSGGVKAVAVNISNVNGTSANTTWTVNIGDTVPPVITNVTNSTVNVSGNSPKTFVTWDTDENADSLVRFGKFSGNLKQYLSNATMTLSHNENVSSLDYGITYYYNVTSKDSNGNSNNSTQKSFAIPACTPSGGGSTTNSIYGAVANSSDNMAGVNATNKGFAVAYNVAEGTSDLADSRNAAEGTQMKDGYFYYDAGALWTNWAKCDDVVVVTEVNNSISKNGANYTASTRRNKSFVNPDIFHPSTLEKIPSPAMSSNGTSYINITWTGLTDEHGNVVNYTVYRSTDNVSYSYVGDSTPQVSGGAVYYNDTAGLTAGATYYYRLKVRFRGGYETEGSSNSSASMKTVSPPPTITDYSPSSLTTVSGAGLPRAFNVSIDQTVNVTWQLNGTTKQTNTSVTYAAYTNASGVLGTWNVTAIASNANGTDQQTWTWTVTSGPIILSYAPSSNPSDDENSSTTFNVTADQTATATWMINGSINQTNASVIDAYYTNSSARVGTWNVTVSVSNANGSNQKTWFWTVSTFSNTTVDTAKESSNWLTNTTGADALAMDVEGDGITGTGQLKWKAAQDESTVPTTLEKGSAGILASLIVSYSVTGNSTYMKALNESANWLVNTSAAAMRNYTGPINGTGELRWKQSDSSTSEVQTGYMRGSTGVISSLLGVYNVTGNTTCMNSVKEGVNWLINNSTIVNNPGGTWDGTGEAKWKSQEDKTEYVAGFSHGAAGIISILSKAYDKLGNAAYMNAAKEGANWLLNTSSIAVRTPTGSIDGTGQLKWKMAEGNDTAYYTGMSYGAAGIVKGLVAVYKATNDTKYLNASKEGANWLKSKVSGGKIEWKEGDPQYITGYEHGAAGVMSALLDVYGITGDSSYLTGWSAASIGDWLMSSAVADDVDGDGSITGSGELRWRYMEGYGDYYVGQEYGSSGIITAFAQLYQETNNADYLKVIKEGLRHLRNSSVCTDVDGNSVVTGSGQLKCKFKEGSDRYFSGLDSGTAAVAYTTSRILASRKVVITTSLSENTKYPMGANIYVNFTVSDLLSDSAITNLQTGDVLLERDGIRTTPTLNNLGSGNYNVSATMASTSGIHALGITVKYGGEDNSRYAAYTAGNVIEIQQVATNRSTLNVSEDFSYNVQVKNVGYAAITNVNVTISYSPSVISRNSPASDTQTISPIASGATAWANYSLKLTASGTYSVTANSTASASGTTADSSASVSTPPPPPAMNPPSLSVTPATSPSTVTRGQNFYFNVTVQNTGDYDAQNVVLDIGNNTSDVEIVSSQCSDPCSIGSLPKGQNTTWWQLRVKNSASGISYATWANVSSSNASNSPQNASGTVTVSKPSLSVSTAQSASSVARDQLFYFNVTVTNTGDEPAAGTILDIGNNISDVEIVSSQCSDPCSIGSLPKGQNTTWWQLRVKTSASGSSYVTWANATSTNATQNDSKSQSVDISRPSTSISASLSSSTVSTNQTFYYNITVANSGKEAANGVTIDLGYPAGVARDSGADPYACPDITTSTPCQQSYALRITGGAGSYALNANATQGNATSQPANKSDTVNVAAPDLRVTVTGPQRVANPSTFSYTVIVQNVGSGSALDVVSSVSPPPCITNATGNLVNNIGTLAAGANVSYDYSLSVSCTAGAYTINNYANATNDNVSTPHPLQVLSVSSYSVSVSPSTIYAGKPATLIMTVSPPLANADVTVTEYNGLGIFVSPQTGASTQNSIVLKTNASSQANVTLVATDIGQSGYSLRVTVSGASNISSETLINVGSLTKPGSSDSLSVSNYWDMFTSLPGEIESAVSKINWVGYSSINTTVPYPYANNTSVPLGGVTYSVNVSPGAVDSGTPTTLRIKVKQANSAATGVKVKVVENDGHSLFASMEQGASLGSTQSAATLVTDTDGNAEVAVTATNTSWTKWENSSRISYKVQVYLVNATSEVLANNVAVYPAKDAVSTGAYLSSQNVYNEVYNNLVNEINLLIAKIKWVLV
jgi:hypothetical protein